MAIIKVLESDEWEKIQELVYRVLVERKMPFSQEVILKVIKNQMTEVGMDDHIMDLVYFQILFLNCLDSLVEDDILYSVDKFYFPVDYMILREYDVRFSDLLYLTENDGHNFTYIHIDTLEKTTSSRPKDFILTGGFLGHGEKQFMKPDVSLEEIASLYHSLIMEGASKEEAIQIVLNYYQITFLPACEEGVHTVMIQQKKRKNKLVKSYQRDTQISNM